MLITLCWMVVCLDFCLSTLIGLFSVLFRTCICESVSHNYSEQIKSFLIVASDCEVS